MIKRKCKNCKWNDGHEFTVANGYQKCKRIPNTRSENNSINDFISPNMRNNLLIRLNREGLCPYYTKIWWKEWVDSYDGFMPITSSIITVLFLPIILLLMLVIVICMAFMILWDRFKLMIKKLK